MPGHDANTQLLLHMDGEDSGVIFTDSTGTFAVTAGGNVITSIAAKKFGRTSAKFDGTGDYLTIANSATFDIFGNNTDSRTIDFWVKHATTSSTVDYITHYVDSDSFWTVRGYTASSNQFTFGCIEAGDWDVVLEVTGTIADTIWHHIAVTKEANVYSFYLDGTRLGQVTDNSTRDHNGNLYIGSRDSGGTNPLNGYIDELRLSNVARWTGASFTVPTSPYYRHGIAKIGGWNVGDVHKINGIYVGNINKYTKI